MTNSNPPMSKARLLDLMRTEHARWEEALAQVSIEQMTRPGLEGDWSVKDVVAHITQYERWLLKWLREALTGVEPLPDEQTRGMTMHERNAWVYQQNRERPLEEVLGESREVYPQLMELLQAAPETDLIDPHRFAWTHGEPLWHAVEGDAYGHYRDHTQGLLIWLEEQRGNTKPE